MNIRNVILMPKHYGIGVYVEPEGKAPKIQQSALH
jgi:hypothetical protein